MLSNFSAHGSQRNILTAMAIILAATASPAYAISEKIYSPRVHKGELELEYAGSRTFDSEKAKDNEQEHKFSVGYGVTDYWAPEIYFATLERGPGEPMDLTEIELESVFQFWDTGKYWLDAGLLAEYAIATKDDEADKVEVKLLLQKDFGRFTTLVNFGGEREVGAHSSGSNEYSSAINTRYRWSPYFEPGIELQSDYGEWDSTSYDEQKHYAGPVVYGMLMPSLKYEVGYLVGISDSAADSAVRAVLEYEMYF